MTRPCGNPHCRCHIANRNGSGWLLGADDFVEQHGTKGTYVRGCRCGECRAAEASYQRGRRARSAS